MRTLVLISAIIGVLAGCKAAQKAPVKLPDESAFGPEDDGAIDVPKELEAATALTNNPALRSRTRLTRENLSKELTPGARLTVKVRGAASIKLELFAKSLEKNLDLDLRGSPLKKLSLKSSMTSLEIPLKSKGEETLDIVVPEGKDLGLQITQLSTAEGEIVSWRIFPR